MVVWIAYSLAAFAFLAAYMERKDPMRAVGFVVVGGLILAAVVSHSVGYWDL